jgi:hypothetical protein
MKVIHRGSKKAKVQAGKRLVTSSGRSGNRKSNRLQAGTRQKALLVRQAKTPTREE